MLCRSNIDFEASSNMFFSASSCASKGHEEFKSVAMNKSVTKFPTHTNFHSVLAATSANTDRARRCIQYAGIGKQFSGTDKLLLTVQHQN